MAQVLLKKSSVVAKVPLTSDLAYGELALNYADGKLYYKTSDGTTINSFNAYTSAGATSLTFIGDVTGTGTTGTNTILTLASNIATNVALSGSVKFSGTLINATSSGVALAYNTAVQATVASTTTTAVDTWPIATYRAAKYIITISQASSYQMSEIRVMHNGTVTVMNDYAALESGSTIGTFSSDINSTNARLLITMASATSAVINIQRTLIVV